MNHNLIDPSAFSMKTTEEPTLRPPDIVMGGFTECQDDEPSDKITYLRVNDVLMGRGGAHAFEGNQKFRKLIKEHRPDYLNLPKNNKPRIARRVVDLWQNQQTPRGRFLARYEDQRMFEGRQVWYEVSPKRAYAKVSQSLRERRLDMSSYGKQGPQDASKTKPQSDEEVPEVEEDSFAWQGPKETAKPFCFSTTSPNLVRDESFSSDQLPADGLDCDYFDEELPLQEAGPSRPLLQLNDLHNHTTAEDLYHSSLGSFKCDDDPHSTLEVSRGDWMTISEEDIQAMSPREYEQYLMIVRQESVLHKMQRQTTAATTAIPTTATGYSSGW